MSASTLIFARPSRSDGFPHRVAVDARTLKPLACTCPAGARGIVCWAALEVAADECVAEAQRRCEEARRVLRRVLERRDTAEHVIALRAEHRPLRRAA